MSKLLPFFTFYGGKNRAAKHYPPPEHELIVEPFAGSAGYALNYPEHDVLLIDADPIIAGTWAYLLRTPADELAALPDLEPGQTVDDLEGLQPEARWLIGWWLNKGSATPKRRASSFMLNHPRGAPYWGQGIRDRIASQIELVRHWRVVRGSYEVAPNVEATWYIDPPYQRAGRHYRYGSRLIDYPALGAWCKSRQGQIMVCEADDADWLPFRPLVTIDGTEGRQKTARARTELIYP